MAFRSPDPGHLELAKQVADLAELTGDAAIDLMELVLIQLETGGSNVPPPEMVGTKSDSLHAYLEFAWTVIEETAASKPLEKSIKAAILMGMCVGTEFERRKHG